MTEGELNREAESVLDPVSAVVSSEAAKSAVGKLFGPAFDAMGQDLAHLYKAWSQPRRANVEAILAKGGQRADKATGYVNPRVLHAVFEDGSWVTDGVAQEYFAGLLLSSRSDSADADDGMYYAGIVAGLTSNQIRIHHAIYRCFAANCTEYPNSIEAKLNNAIWMPVEESASLIRVIEGDDPLEVVSEAIEALAQKGLLGHAGVGTPEMFKEADTVTSIDSSVSVATDMGIRLFLRAYGIRTSDPKQLFNFDWNNWNQVGEVAPSAFLGPYDKGF